MQIFNPKANLVFCRKYQQNLPKMPNPPFPNAKGQELQNTVWQKAWNEWLDKDAKKFIAQQRELFLDNGDYERPAGFKPKDS